MPIAETRPHEAPARIHDLGVRPEAGPDRGRRATAMILPSLTANAWAGAAPSRAVNTFPLTTSTPHLFGAL
jgi:hypothetical protein